MLITYQIKIFLWIPWGFLKIVRLPLFRPHKNFITSILSNFELAMLRNHVQTGYDILKNIHFPWNVAQIVLQHHERIDGSGYPNGLKGDSICEEAKIIAVADVVEAISSDRPYRKSRGIEAALDEITTNSGKLYDARVVEACLKVFKDDRYDMAAIE
ncbi:MAG: HD domain-containing protein [Chitinophagia bacterium]|nr:HD domain-containing protein [Chitinophagia bacterium]